MRGIFLFIIFLVSLSLPAQQNKGVFEVDVHEGFKVGPQALKNFDISLVALTGKAPWRLPKTSIVRTGEERNLFRLRNGFFKRVDFSVVSTGNGVFVVESSDLAAGDSVVTTGMGFLRIAEISAFGGVADGHAH